MNLKELSVEDLKPGDIFLLSFKHPAVDKYFEALYAVLKGLILRKDWNEFLGDALLILDGLIVSFDRDRYTHASFWDGEMIVEAGLGGVKRNLLETYRGIDVHVYRYAVDGELKLGTPGYPVQPLADRAKWLAKQDLNYSYTTAILFMFLCVTRWEREEWIQEMEDFLKRHVRIVNPEVIDILFKLNHDKLTRFFEWMADEMIRRIVAFRKDEGLVCSETVATIFNETEPVGKYHIDKPLNVAQNKAHEPVTLEHSSSAKEALEKFVSLLEHNEIPATAENDRRNWNQVIDIMYTPHDIARSQNTQIAGRINVDGLNPNISQ